MLRNDSLSSDQSESLRPPPPRPYKSKRGVGAGGKRQASISSSEEEGGTTPEYSSCEDAEIQSVSERGEQHWQAASLAMTNLKSSYQSGEQNLLVSSHVHSLNETIRIM